MRGDMPLAELRESSWFESMEGLKSAEEGRNDINTLLGGEKGKINERKSKSGKKAKVIGIAKPKNF